MQWWNKFINNVDHDEMPQTEIISSQESALFVKISSRKLQHLTPQNTEQTNESD